jgi:hypothetical protein
MNEDNRPDWAAELAKGGEALGREALLIVRAAEEFARDTPLARRLARAVDAGMRELLSPPEHPVVHNVTIHGTVAAVSTLAAVGTITASASLALPRIGIAAQGTVENPPRGLAGLSDGQMLALVLVWLFAIALPRVQAVLTPEMQAILSNYYATLGLALIITWRISDKRM